MRILVPDCVKLDDKQLEVLQKWAEPLETYEPDCCGTGHMFEICGSGLGDNITVRHGNKRINLGYDDDGDILGEPCHKDSPFGHSWENPPGFHVSPVKGMICTYCGFEYP